MANRYWVGGTGTWDATSTTNWAASSGGASGASAPTSADNVFFDANSNVGTGAFTVTVSNAVCNDFTASGLDGAMTLAISPSTLTVYGSWSNPSTNFSIPSSAGGILSFAATTTGKTINFNGVSSQIDLIKFDGVGGYWTLASSMSQGSGQITRLINGTLDTSTSNYSLTLGTFDLRTATASSALKLNASTINIGNSWLAAGSLVTLTAGTSAINMNFLSASFDGGGLTYYDLSYTSSSATTAIKTLLGSNTFHNLVINNPSASGVITLSITGNQTITGRLTANSSGNILQRISLRSSVLGSAVTLTCNNTTIGNNDFRDITIAGAAAPVSPSNAGDCGGNSGIIFPVAKTVYWNLAAGGNWSANAWATSSGGSPASGNFPLAQDTVIIENTGLNASATITYDAIWSIGNFSASTRTNAAVISYSNAPVFYGNFAWGTGLSTSSAVTFSFTNAAIKTFNSAGYTFTSQSLNINSTSTGGIQLVTNSLSCSSVTLTQGTFDLNNLALTVNSFFSSTNTNTRTLAFGAGTITCSGTGIIWNSSTSTNLTVTGTPIVNVTSTGSTAITVSTGSLSEANSISFNFTGGTYSLTFPNGSIFSYKNVDFTGFAGTWNTLDKGICYGNMTLSTGMTLSASSGALVFSATNGIKTITSNGKTMDWPVNFNGAGGTWKLQDAMTVNSTRTTSLTNGTVDLNGNSLTTGIFGTSVGTKNITFNGGTITVSGSGTTAWNNAQPTGFTTTAGTGVGVISMTSASAKTFVGGGSTYNCTLNQGGAGALTVSGNNTFNNITSTTLPSTITLTSGSTQTFNNFSLSGTAGNLVTLNSSVAGSRATISKSSGIVSVNYVSIKDSAATGGAVWQSYLTNGNVNNGNNTGWIFVPSTGNFLLMFTM